MNASTSEYVTIGKQRLHVAVSGSGRPLLLVNGIGANLEMWQPLVERLDAEVIRFDAPGTGRSPTPRLPFSIRGLSALAGRLLDALGYQHVDVLGLSLGGVVAQQMAISSPTRVRRLVLVSTTWGMGFIPGSFTAWRRLASPQRYYVPGYYERHAQEFLGGRVGRDEDAAQLYAELRRSHPPQLRGHVYQMLAASTWSTLPALHRTRAKTLVVAGDEDPLIPVVNARLIGRRIPDSTVHIVRGGGHLAVIDSADEVAPVINRFLA